MFLQRGWLCIRIHNDDASTIYIFLLKLLIYLFVAGFDVFGSAYYFEVARAGPDDACWYDWLMHAWKTARSLAHGDHHHTYVCMRGTMMRGWSVCVHNMMMQLPWKAINQPSYIYFPFIHACHIHCCQNETLGGWWAAATACPFTDHHVQQILPHPAVITGMLITYIHLVNDAGSLVFLPVLPAHVASASEVKGVMWAVLHTNERAR